MIKEHGSALLITLMILALMAALAAEMTISFQTQLQRSRRVNDHIQAKYTLFYAEERATSSLLQQLQAKEGVHTPFPSDESEIMDNQACYNLNVLTTLPTEALITPSYDVLVFMALLEKLGIEKHAATVITQSLADNIDADTQPRWQGAEDEYYQQKGKQQLTANQFLFLTSEIRSLRGGSPSLYRNLSPYVCAQFSSQLMVNINSLTDKQAPLLSALFLNEIDDDDARSLLRKRPQAGWETIDAFIYQAQKDHSATKPLVDTLKKYLTTRSQYYLIATSFREGEFTSGMRTFLFYDEKNQQLRVYMRQLTAGGGN
ncbi:type II secretion system minor pseudopilin GspK [Enterobacter chuandaensis]|uniref:type II secretion system minor pseudopilin GspK n=1 Tax=Enterobacter chuandaensis TaxID=2497875 RepID=UPI003D6E5DB8